MFPSPSLLPDAVRALLSKQQHLPGHDLLLLLGQAQTILRAEPTLLTAKVAGPGGLNVVGDLHGQFFDLLDLLDDPTLAGGDERATWLFLGDYVDRGDFSCEVMIYLLALKVAYPDRILLLRGNHETKEVATYYGFRDECIAKYGVSTFQHFVAVFELLPLAALIEIQTGAVHAQGGGALAGGGTSWRWLCCHGGISPQLRSLSDFDGIDRHCEPDEDETPLIFHTLWADPVECPESQLGWGDNDARGTSVTFGADVLSAFLEANDLRGVIRAHEFQQDGFKWGFEGKGPDGDGGVVSLEALPPVVTVFSAPNYRGRDGNQGGVLRFFFGGGDGDGGGGDGGGGGGGGASSGSSGSSGGGRSGTGTARVRIVRRDPVDAPDVKLARQSQAEDFVEFRRAVRPLLPFLRFSRPFLYRAVARYSRTPSVRKRVTKNRWQRARTKINAASSASSAASLLSPPPSSASSSSSLSGGGSDGGGGSPSSSSSSSSSPPPPPPLPPSPLKQQHRKGPSLADVVLGATTRLKRRRNSELLPSARENFLDDSFSRKGSVHAGELDTEMLAGLRLVYKMMDLEATCAVDSAALNAFLDSVEFMSDGDGDDERAFFATAAAAATDDGGGGASSKLTAVEALARDMSEEQICQYVAEDGEAISCDDFVRLAVFLKCEYDKNLDRFHDLTKKVRTALPILRRTLRPKSSSSSSSSSNGGGGSMDEDRRTSSSDVPVERSPSTDAVAMAANNAGIAGLSGSAGASAGGTGAGGLGRKWTGTPGAGHLRHQSSDARAPFRARLSQEGARAFDSILQGSDKKTTEEGKERDKAPSGTLLEEAAEEQAGGATAGEGRFFYRDDEGDVQGPYARDVVAGWIASGYFSWDRLFDVPEPWMPVVDAQSGDLYYHDTRSDEVAWDLPQS